MRPVAREQMEVQHDIGTPVTRTPLETWIVTKDGRETSRYIMLARLETRE